MDHLDEEKLSAFMEGDLPAEESRAAESHLKDCVRCSQALEQLREMVTSLSQLPDLVPPADLRVRINERLSRNEPWGSRAWRWFTLEWLPIPARVAGTMAVAVLVVGIGLWFTPDYWRRVLEDERPEEQLARHPSAVTGMDRFEEEEQLEPTDEAYVRDRGGVELAKEGRGKLGKGIGTRRIPSVSDLPDVARSSEEGEARWSTLEGGREQYDSSLSTLHGLGDAAGEEVTDFGREIEEAVPSAANEAARVIETKDTALAPGGRLKEGEREYGSETDRGVVVDAYNGRLVSGPAPGKDAEGLRFRGESSTPLADVTVKEGQAAEDRGLGRRVLPGVAEPEGEPDSGVTALGYLAASPETLTGRASEAMERARAELKEMEAGEASISLQKQAEEKLAAALMQEPAKAGVTADDRATLKDRHARIMELADMKKAIRDGDFEEAERRSGEELQSGVASETRREAARASEALDSLQQQVAEPGGEELLAKEMMQPGEVEESGLPGAEELGEDVVLSFDTEQPVAGDVMDDSLEHYAFARKRAGTPATDYALYPGGGTVWAGYVARQGYDLVLQAGDPAALEQRIDEVVLANGWTVVEEDLAEEEAVLFFSKERLAFEVSQQWGDAVELDSAHLEEELADEGWEDLNGNGLPGIESESADSRLREAERREPAAPAAAQVKGVTRVVRVQVPVEERTNALTQIANLVQPTRGDYVKYWYYRKSDRTDAEGAKSESYTIYSPTDLEAAGALVLLETKTSSAKPEKGEAAAIAAASRPAASTGEVFFDSGELFDADSLDVPAGHGGSSAASRQRRLGVAGDGEEWFRKAGESGLVTLSILLEPLEQAPPHPAADEPTQILLERHK